MSEHDTTTVPCGCGDYAITVSALDPIEVLTVHCPECDNYFVYDSLGTVNTGVIDD